MNVRSFSGTVGLEGARQCPPPTPALPLSNIHEHRQLVKLPVSQTWLGMQGGQGSWSAQFCSCLCFYMGLLAGQTDCVP